MSIELKYISFFLLVFFDLILILIYLLQKRFKDNFTPELFFPIAYLSYYAVGFIFVIDDIPLKEIFLFIIGIIAYFIGIFFVNIIHLKGKIKSYTYFYHKTKFTWIYVSYLTIGIFATFYVFSMTGIPLLHSDIDVARESVSENAYIATLGRFLSVAFMVGFSYAFLYKGKNIGFIVAVLVIFLISLLHGSRELPAGLLLMSLFFFNYRVNFVKRKTLIKIFSLIIVLVILLSFYRSYALFGEAMLSTFGNSGTNNIIRVMGDIAGFYLSNEFSVSLLNFSKFIDLIPWHVDYYYGKLFISPLILPLPGEQKVPGAVIKEIMGGEWTGAGASATLIGIFYADFGIAGVIWGMILVGILLKFLHVKAIRNSTSILWVGLYSFFLLNAIVSLRSNFTQGFDVILMPCLIAIFHFLTIKRKQRNLIGKER